MFMRLDLSFCLIVEFGRFLCFHHRFHMPTVARPWKISLTGEVYR